MAEREGEEREGKVRGRKAGTCRDRKSVNRREKERERERERERGERGREREGERGREREREREREKDGGRNCGLVRAKMWH